MSESINAKNGNSGLRWRLLTTVSALALIGGVYAAPDAKADDADRPTIWIELGGTFEHLNASQTPFLPPFTGALPDFVTVSPVSFQKPPVNGFGLEGALSYQPEGSDWVISASVRYGRALNSKIAQQQTPFATPKAKAYNFFNAEDKNTATHAIVDFRVGKDVGLGGFGNADSTLSLGLRFAQFTTQSGFNLSENSHGHTCLTGGCVYDVVKGEIHSARNFHGFGPSISWNGSAPFAGNPSRGELSINWGAKGAVLFGRQKVNILHHTQAVIYDRGVHGYLPSYQAGGTPARARSVTVPNASGFAGVSYRLENFRVKLGYRADIYFGAMDGGIDTAKKENVGFYGPFASVSVGLGG